MCKWKGIIESDVFLSCVAHYGKRLAQLLRFRMVLLGGLWAVLHALWYPLPPWLVGSALVSEFVLLVACGRCFGF